MSVLLHESGERFRDIPVVIHSSLSGSADESHARSVGAEGHAGKFVPEELRTIEQTACQRGMTIQEGNRGHGEHSCSARAGGQSTPR